MKNKELERTYQAAHYQANKSLYKSRAAESRKRLRLERQTYVRELKEATPCIQCGESYPYYVMDFHHCDDSKETNVCRMVSSVSMTRLKIEIAKCDIICANCHRIVTHAPLAE